MPDNRRVHTPSDLTLQNLPAASISMNSKQATLSRQRKWPSQSKSRHAIPFGKPAFFMRALLFHTTLNSPCSLSRHPRNLLTPSAIFVSFLRLPPLAPSTHTCTISLVSNYNSNKFNCLSRRCCWKRGCVSASA